MEPALHALPQGFSSAPSPLAKAPASPPPTPPSSGDENSDQFAWKRLDKGKGREVPAGGTPTESVSAGVAAPLQPQLSKEFAQARSLLLSKDKALSSLGKDAGPSSALYSKLSLLSNSQPTASPSRPSPSLSPPGTAPAFTASPRKRPPQDSRLPPLFHASSPKRLRPAPIPKTSSQLESELERLANGLSLQDAHLPSPLPSLSVPSIQSGIEVIIIDSSDEEDSGVGNEDCGVCKAVRVIPGSEDDGDAGGDDAGSGNGEREQNATVQDGGKAGGDGKGEEFVGPQPKASTSKPPPPNPSVPLSIPLPPPPAPPPPTTLKAPTLPIPAPILSPNTPAPRPGPHHVGTLVDRPPPPPFIPEKKLSQLTPIPMHFVLYPPVQSNPDCQLWDRRNREDGDGYRNEESGGSKLNRSPSKTMGRPQGSGLLLGGTASPRRRCIARSPELAIPSSPFSSDTSTSPFEATLNERWDIFASTPFELPHLGILDFDRRKNSFTTIGNPKNARLMDLPERRLEGLNEKKLTRARYTLSAMEDKGGEKESLPNPWRTIEGAGPMEEDHKFMTIGFEALYQMVEERMVVDN